MTPVRRSQRLFSGAVVACLLLMLLASCNLSRVPDETATAPVLIPTLTVPPTFTPTPTPNITPTPTTSPEIVLFLGDSITQGWRVDRLYPAAINGGHWGDTSGQTLARYRQHYTGFYYDAIAILTGINDITGGVDEQELRDNLTTLVSEVDGASEKVVLGALLPVGPNNYGPQVSQRIIQTNAWLREFAASRGYSYADYYSAVASADGYAAPGFLQDGLHPTGAGYEAMAAVLADALAR